MGRSYENAGRVVEALPVVATVLIDRAAARQAVAGDQLTIASDHTSPSLSQPAPLPRWNTASVASTSPAGIDSNCASLW